MVHSNSKQIRQNRIGGVMTPTDASTHIYPTIEEDEVRKEAERKQPENSTEVTLTLLCT